MRSVMMKAWEIAREGAKKFGGKAIEYIAEALRMAWAIVKKDAMELIELVGTEKQVKWAEDIRRIYIENIEEVKRLADEIEKLPAKGTIYRRNKEQLHKEFKQMLIDLLKNESAKFWIENFQNLTDKREWWPHPYRIARILSDKELAGETYRVAQRIVHYFQMS